MQLGGLRINWLEPQTIKSQIALSNLKKMCEQKLTQKSLGIAVYSKQTTEKSSFNLLSLYHLNMLK